MKILRISLVILSALLLAAHFLRSGNLVVVVLVGAAPLLLLFRSPWAVRLLQIFLCFGTLEWGRTSLVLYRFRVAGGEPWLRMVLILGVVASITILSAILLEKEAALRAGLIGPRHASE